MSEHGPNGRETTADDREKQEAKLMSRRRLLQATGALIVTVGVGSACDVAPFDSESPAARPLRPQPPPAFVPRRVRLAEGQYPVVPDTPTQPPASGTLRFFTLHEAQTVEAVTARILPGTPDDPGAREAGVVSYIDNMLAYDNPFAEATYRQPPFAETYEGERPPTGSSGDFEVVWVNAAEIERYGYQSTLGPRDVYRAGIASVDRYARARFGGDFVDLSEEQQDQIVGAMADGEATGFENPGAEEFFHVLRRHTGEGMFSDPVYGGNQGLAGWRLIGYAGAQRGYTEAYVRGQVDEFTPQGIADLNHFHPGQPVNDHVLLPVSGSRLKESAED